ncbi:hypothetical protein [Shewanella donghaensis]|uniref:hypothetical protein n=1 Tax=Shewanella donghaensis TaxID=238836 RepID=UPI001183DD28|nr:hypothetical protein [Shewanella donghaensis]
MKFNIINKALNRVAYVTDRVNTIVFNETTPEGLLTTQGYNKPWFVILGRQHYSESHHVYPIPDEREALKAAKFELKISGSTQFFNAYRLDEQSYSVTVWTINEAILDSLCKNALFIIPESFLFAQDGLLVTVELENNCQVFISQSRKGPVSYIVDDFIEDTESFCQLAEIALPSESKLVNKSSFPKDLLHFSKSALPSSFYRFFVGSSVVKSTVVIPYKAMLLSFCSIIFLYNILLSSFLSWRESSVVNEFEEKKVQVEQVLDSQNKLANQVELNRILSSQIKIDDTPWRALEVIGSLVNAEMQITNISFRAGEYRVTGVAEKATTILSLVNSNKSVYEASFSGPIRESRSGERFGINFKTKAY